MKIGTLVKITFDTDGEYCCENCGEWLYFDDLEDYEIVGRRFRDGAEYCLMVEDDCEAWVPRSYIR